MNAGTNNTGDSAGAPVVLVTGAAKRLGAAIASALHQHGWRVVIHYRQSRNEAEDLAARLNTARPDSATTVPQTLGSQQDCEQLAAAALEQWQRLDALVNNASSFYPTPVGAITEQHWDDLIGSNLKMPLFLSQAAAPALKQKNGAIINMADVHALQALPRHAVYGAAKAGLVMLTRILARELAPQVRVNAIAPGHILPASHGGQDADAETRLIANIPLARSGEPEDIAEAVAFLLSEDASYITGAVLPVDGGKLA